VALHLVFSVLFLQLFSTLVGTGIIPIWYAISAHILCEVYIYLLSANVLVRGLLIDYIYMNATTPSWFHTLELRSTNLIHVGLVSTYFLDFPRRLSNVLVRLLTDYPTTDGIILP
jgi:hypothetical protein